MDRTVLDAREFATADSTTAGIQEAIDPLPAGGGVVNLPAGRYSLRRSVQLRAGVTVRGDGQATAGIK
jgi:polygalacturonase